MSKHKTLTGYDFREDEPLRPLKAIRMKRLDCCCGSSQQVKACGIVDCTLWPYRLCRKLNRTSRVLTDEQRERLRKARAKAAQNRAE